MAKKKKQDESSQPQDATKAFEQALEETDDNIYVLRLYVSGLTPNSQRAIENVRKICNEHLKGRYHLEIIDIYQQPTLAGEGQIIAAPTLIKELPLPLRKFIGDMSKTERILVGLDLRKKE
ncbi:MAG: thiol-disulfide isomerase [Desulfobulbaceae bacterium BRH_c16a]|nr:MAG: thiol-disulfide isomerase [Desulfobulbaceae bacterium BRH_c16a]